MLRILGKLQSINVRKVLWTCDELGIPYDREDWGAGFRSTDDPAFIELNPKGLVPVIVDDGFVLTESNTIMRYLAARHHARGLLPEDARGRAEVEELMDWQATELNWSWRVAFQAIVRRNAAAGTPGQIERSLSEWRRQMQLLERRLARTEAFIVGDAFTLADIAIGLSVNRWFQTPFEKPELPSVSAYFGRLAGRAAAARYMGGLTD
ncbi:MAG: glutathione S-transferase family protein [Beijerinckiaceae bacterium]